MIDSEIYQAFNDNPVAWENFKTFPKLYQRVRIDSIQRDKKKDRAVFDICLEKLIEQSEAGKCLVFFLAIHIFVFHKKFCRCV